MPEDEEDNEEKEVKYDEKEGNLEYKQEKKDKDYYEELEEEVEGIYLSKRLLKILVTLAFLGIIAYIVILPISAPEIDRTAVEYGVFEEINNERIETSNSGHLLYDPRLREASRYHSEQMGKKDFFSHISPSGIDTEDRYEMINYECEQPTGSSQTFEHIIKAKYDSKVQTPSGNSVTFDNEEDLIKGISQEILTNEIENYISDKQFDRAAVGVYIDKSDTVYVTFNLC